MLRTKGEAGTGNVVEAVRHARTVNQGIRRLQNMDEDELFVAAKELKVSPILWILLVYITNVGSIRSRQRSGQDWEITRG